MPIEFKAISTRSRDIEDSQTPDFFQLTERGHKFIQQLTASLESKTADRAFAITGPHGAGKSALARFVLDLTLPPRSERRQRANVELERYPELAKDFTSALQAVGSPRGGWRQIAATANREPIIDTLDRALGISGETLSNQDRVARILERAREFVTERPTILVIDEFGKSLEYLANDGSGGDVFVIQRLVETLRGQKFPFVMITLQHLSQFEYLRHASESSRVEWTKVSGRFMDFTFADSAHESRKLLSSLFTKSSKLQTKLENESSDAFKLLAQAGLDSDLECLKKLLPLHPMASLVAPHIATLLAQGERTLFDFVGGAHPHSLKSFVELVTDNRISLYGLSDLYDYFSDAQRQAAATGPAARRWLEIDDRVRSASSLDDVAIQTLKSVGLLNLVAGSDGLRASTELIHLAMSVRQRGITLPATRKQLAFLAKLGYITYREFAGEWRLWEGSDVDVQSAVDDAFAGLTNVNVGNLLNTEYVAEPLVVSRPTLDKGILRLARRLFMEAGEIAIDPSSEATVVLSLDDSLPSTAASTLSNVVLIRAGEVGHQIREIALQIAAHRKVSLQLASGLQDRVAINELNLRIAMLDLRLQRLLASAWERPCAMYSAKGWNSTPGSLQVILSAIVTSRYSQAPRVANEMIARQHPTGQAIRARRLLAERMLLNYDQASLGLAGFRPERAFYMAILESTGMHTPASTPEEAYGRPGSPEWGAIWDVIGAQLDKSVESRKTVDEIVAPLREAPFGIKDGLLPILFLAVFLSRKSSLALYEYGSLVIDIDDAVLERLLKNQPNFSVREYGLSNRGRSACALAMQNWLEADTFIDAILKMFGLARKIPQYGMNSTVGLSKETIAFRKALLSSPEPDVLVFEDVPRALGMKPVDEMKPGEVEMLVSLMKRAFEELTGAYPKLLLRLEGVLKIALGAVSDRGGLGLAFQALTVHPTLSTDAEMRSLVLAGARSQGDGSEWIENIAMVVSGLTPRSWGDEEEALFIEQSTALLTRAVRTIDLVSNEARITVSTIDGEQSLIVKLEDVKKFLDSLQSSTKLSHTSEID